MDLAGCLSRPWNRVSPTSPDPRAETHWKGQRRIAQPKAWLTRKDAEKFDLKILGL